MEGHVVESLLPAVAMAHAFDGDGERINGRHFLHYAGVRFCGGRQMDVTPGPPMGHRFASAAMPCSGLAV